MNLSYYLKKLEKPRASNREIKEESKMSKEEWKEYFSVKEVISPELIKLNNGLTVRLIGVKEKKIS